LQVNARSVELAGVHTGKDRLQPRRGRFKELSDLGDGFGARRDVAHDGARVAVAGLDHDELQRYAFIAEVGGSGVA
jgi:hypothetical protein